MWKCRVSRILCAIFHWHYSQLWALACQTMSFHFILSATNSLHLLTPSTWRSLSASSFHLFLGPFLLLVPSITWVKIFLGILFCSILSRWPNQLILCPFIHFTMFSPLLVSSSSQYAWLFHSPFSYLGPYILLNIFLSKISRACSSFFVNVQASGPYDTTFVRNDSRYSWPQTWILWMGLGAGGRGSTVSGHDCLDW